MLMCSSDAYAIRNRTTVDMSMVAMDTSFADYLIDLVQTGVVPESRVDDSATRIMQLKKDLGIVL